jgi:hypothetical protein
VLARASVTLLLCASASFSAPIEDAFARMYNFDFAGAHRILDAYIEAHPGDPFGHTVRGAAYLFSELDRLRILEAEFLTDDKKISGDDKLKPDPVVRKKLFASIERAQQLAEALLKDRPGDTGALFSFCMTEGIRTDYMAFVEKKQLRSLFAAKKSQTYAVELLKRDPEFIDAHLTTGISEYLIGSLPFFVRWIVRFDQVKGSKEQAVANLARVGASGRYLGPFARILLSIIHVREKRPSQAIALLEDLTREFPHNPLLRKELARLREKHSEVPPVE